MLTIAGAGTGEIINSVKDAIKESDIIIAHERFKYLVPVNKKFIALKDFDLAFNIIESEPGNKLILVSGDPGLYSLLSLVKKRFADFRVIPGISSLQSICAHARESWQDSKILSGHGRDLKLYKFLNIIERNRINILFCDDIISPEWVCKNLADFDYIDIFIGERLGTEQEKIFSGIPSEFINNKFSQPAIVLIRNNNIYEYIRPSDKNFLREPGVHITNENIRAIILDKLALNQDSILWDIGAGSGSISVSAAQEFIFSEIHAIECKPDAAKLIYSNAKKFHVHNINIHEGRAVNIIKFLPNPSHIFIGGNDGELTGILEYISRMKHKFRLVIECVTLETLYSAFDFMKNFSNFEALQVMINTSKQVADSLTLMKAHSPVNILSADINY